MNAAERRNAILDILFRQRHITTAALAEQLGVTERTIRSDITSLSCFYPIRTVRGRYGGGICLEDWFQPHRKTLDPTQEALLRRLSLTLSDEDLAILNGILAQFAPSRS